MMENKNINNIKLINIWLLTTIILVFLMIIVGGLTRLTDSGLSITQWELFTGILPPLTNESWNNYFDLFYYYKIYRKKTLIYILFHFFDDTFSGFSGVVHG